MSQFDKYVKIAQEMINEANEKKIDPMLEKLKSMKPSELSLLYDDNTDADFALGLSNQDNTFDGRDNFEEEDPGNQDSNVKKIQKALIAINGKEGKLGKRVKLDNSDGVFVEFAVDLSNELLKKLSEGINEKKTFKKIEKFFKKNENLFAADIDEVIYISKNENFLDFFEGKKRKPRKKKSDLFIVSDDNIEKMEKVTKKDIKNSHYFDPDFVELYRFILKDAIEVGDSETEEFFFVKKI